MALIGANGGLIGAARTSRRGAAVGIWTPNEQVIYQRQNAWIGDASFTSVSLLLHMDGSNASTTFVDSSLNNLAVTANGNAQISTAQSKFGGASGLFDGNGDYLFVAANALFDVLSGDSTVEFWFKHNNPSDTLGSSIICVGQSSGYWQIIIRSGQILLNSSPNGSTFNNYSANQTLDTGWHYFAWTKQATTHRLFYDGVLLSATGTAPTSTSSNALYIGANYNGGTSSFNGYIDDLRITKGVARYTANFTPPIAAFPDA
jgi:hypothetical protein